MNDEKKWIDLPNGCALYIEEDTDVGGRKYYSDEIGGGVLVWHTALVNPSTLLVALAEEAKIQRQEWHDKKRKEVDLL